jgi:hypothetical protein
MPTCRSAEQIAGCQRDGCPFPIECLTPMGVRHYRGGLEAFEREQSVWRRSGNVGI